MEEIVIEGMPFNIKYRPEIEAGKYLIQTREGRKARIIQWVGMGHYPIVALVQNNGSEFAHTYTEKGKFNDSVARTAFDLFLIPNPDYKEPTAESSVDLEKEIEKYFSKWVQGASDEGCFNADSQLVSIYDCHRLARYFYGLGLNARKED